ncbi:MAG: efflux RND transporter periplasmic adaptor subunit [Deltaproteobacteria bacterium]|nr:MAG: efflux RND transporter periplasmic adaptor subunit [Deltaproteobacteria bacterium]HXG96148.1 efflux RND transporter periplasmic adaptor subunit [Gemmatimonadales bacterium]
MNRAILLIVLLLAACRKETQADSMAGMDMSDTASADSGMTGRAPVHLTPEQARAVGVTFTVVQRGPLVRTVRTVGQVLPAEPNLADITTKIDGFVEQLFVNATGTSVRRGQPLLTLYSPMLVAAQEELLAAKRLDSAAHSEDTEALLAASRRRLSYWDISREQIERLERTGEVTKTLALNAPVDGIVLEKMVVAGQAVMPGMKLYRIADLSTIWIEGAVFEQDLGLVRVGAPVSAEFTTYPGRRFAGRVSFVWPTVNDSSRSGRIRVAFANRRGELRPGMYATLLLEAVVDRDAVNVPAEAVVQTGERNLVFVVGPSGALEPREVVLGARAGDRFQIDSGLAAGERIVASANFLVDAESRLTAGAGSTMPGMNMGTEKRP